MIQFSSPNTIYGQILVNSSTLRSNDEWKKYALIKEPMELSVKWQVNE